MRRKQIIKNVGSIIGHRGVTIKRLREESGCQIRLDTSDKTDHEGKRHVYISGYSLEKCQQVKKEIMELVEQNKLDKQIIDNSGFKKNQNPNSMSNMNNNNNRHPPGVDEYLHPVQNDLCGFVIGTRGETVKLMQKQVS